MEKKLNFVLLTFVLCVFLIGLAISQETSALKFSLSNKSIEAKDTIKFAELCFENMNKKKLPLQRANESLNQALQLYSAQLSLEENAQKANYELVLDYAQDVCKIEKIAVESDDELKIFNETFLDAKTRINVSVMEEDYNAILNSFKEERFEETLKLIKEGYVKLSDLEASQTALKLFYATTTASVKEFLKENWKNILFVFGGILIFLFIFWQTFQKIKIKSKFNNLRIEKDTLNDLIKQLQRNYFDKKTLSELEYSIKLEKFKEMIRDIGRQLPLLNEKMMRIEKKNFLGRKSKNRLDKNNKKINKMVSRKWAIWKYFKKRKKFANK